MLNSVNCFSHTCCCNNLYLREIVMYNHGSLGQTQKCVWMLFQFKVCKLVENPFSDGETKFNLKSLRWFTEETRPERGYRFSWKKKSLWKSFHLGRKVCMRDQRYGLVLCNECQSCFDVANTLKFDIGRDDFGQGKGVSRWKLECVIGLCRFLKGK